MGLGSARKGTLAPPWPRPAGTRANRGQWQERNWQAAQYGIGLWFWQDLTLLNRDRPISVRHLNLCFTFRRTYLSELPCQSSRKKNNEITILKECTCSILASLPLRSRTRRQRHITLGQTTFIKASCPCLPRRLKMRAGPALSRNRARMTPNGTATPARGPGSPGPCLPPDRAGQDQAGPAKVQRAARRKDRPGELSIPVAGRGRGRRAGGRPGPARSDLAAGTCRRPRPARPSGRAAPAAPAAAATRGATFHKHDSHRLTPFTPPK